MLWYDVNHRSKQLLIGAAVTVGLLAAYSHAAYALDGQIGAVVCGPDTVYATTAITEPLDDSVVNQASVTVRGTVQNAAQIQMSLDGQYSTTIAIAANATTFQTNLTVPEGTHTIGIEAYGICGGQTATDSTVITFQPVSSPSSGVITPTSVEGVVTLDGERVDSNTFDDANDIQQLQNIPVFGPIIGSVIDLYALTGLKETVASGESSVITGAARVGLTVAAVSSVVLAGSLAPVAVHAVPGISEVFHASSHRSMIYLEWIIRGFGVLAMTIAYFL